MSRIDHDRARRREAQFRAADEERKRIAAADDAHMAGMTADQLRETQRLGEAAGRELVRRRGPEIEAVEERVRLLGTRGPSAAMPFTPSDLVYAAEACCVCGAGLAYPHGVGLHGSWECSAILTGAAAAGTTHDEGKPFAFWSVLSEDSMRAGGATTRPEAA